MDKGAQKMTNHSQKIRRQSDRSVDEPIGTSVEATPKRASPAHKTVHAIFEMLQILDEKVTKINNRFSNLAKELGYKV